MPHQPPKTVRSMQMTRFAVDVLTGIKELLLVKVITKTEVQKVYRTNGVSMV